MAYTTQENGFAERASGTSLFGLLVASVREALQKRRIYVRTINELESLSDRELSEMGVHRSGIKRVAIDAAWSRT